MGRDHWVSLGSAIVCCAMLTPESRAAEAAPHGPQASAPAAVPAPLNADVAYLSAAEIKRRLDDNAAKFLDETMRAVDTGHYTVQMGVTMRALPSPPGSFSHDKVTEVMYVLSGSAIEETGGQLVDPKPLDAGVSGPSHQGSSATGGHVRTVGPGDISIIPPGVPHRYIRIIEPISFLTIRIDPERVISVGSRSANSLQELSTK